ncbi:phage terminase small subunit-related protein, partial [Anaerospora hongkongensis]|uniref:phage terminase small subunit-related protein n=1 Tax=Anaerospora hongkongensis TaxID=244830 RepID=UPI0028A2ADA5
MARARNPDRDRAFLIWLDSGGTAKLSDIAAQIGVPDSRIRKWKTEDKWDEKIKERSDSAKIKCTPCQGQFKKGAYKNL